MDANALLLVAAALTGILVIDAATYRHDDLSNDQALYCEMVETFKATSGEYGWPDYLGTYAEACKGDAQ